MALEPQEGKGSIFVTGGTGLVGKRIVSRLRQLGYCVLVLSRGNLMEGLESVEVISGDITNGKLLEEAVSGCDAIIHCAAELKDVNKMYEINVVGTRNVYEAARKNRVRYFCHLSSVGVIGRTNQRVVDEQTPCDPINPYERTKWEAEQIVEKGIEGCSSVILRPTNVFAEEIISPDSYRGIGSAVKVWLTGKERSHLIYAADVVEAAIYLRENCAHDGCEKFIVSSDEEPGGASGDVYDAVRQLLGYRVTKRRFTCPVELAYYLRLLRYGHANRGDVCYSARRLLRTGFKIPFGWFEGIRRCVEFNQHRVKMVS